MFWLIWQMGLILLAAFALGLFFGRQIWSGDARSAEADQALAEASRLRNENENLARRLGESEARHTDVTPTAEPAVPASAADVESADAKAEPAETEKPAPLAERSVSKLDQPASSAQPKKVARKSGQADGAVDELTRIKGLGPKAAAALHDGGVTRFAQIAGWTAKDVEDWDARINGRGRITRDDWVGQAKVLSA